MFEMLIKKSINIFIERKRKKNEGSSACSAIQCMQWLILFKEIFYFQCFFFFKKTFFKFKKIFNF